MIMEAILEKCVVPSSLGDVASYPKGTRRPTEPIRARVVRLTADRFAGGNALPKRFLDAAGLRYGGVR